MATSMHVSILIGPDSISIYLYIAMLSNATIRHCSRPADRDGVVPPDPATDRPGKCRFRPHATHPSDERDMEHSDWGNG